MEVTFAEEIESGRKTLLENCDNLEQIANYCEDNYVKAKDKKVALQETKNFTTQSLASVAYQINTLATSMLQMLDCTATKIGDMDSNMNQINLAIDLNNERIARQTFRSSLLTPKDHTRTRKLTKPDNPPSFKQVVKYVSTPVDYGSLDDVGHGLKFGQPSSSPRGSRSGSLRSVSSVGSGKNSLRQKSSAKKSIRSPISIPSPTPSTNSLQPPVFTQEMYLDNSFNSDNSDRLPPPPSPPPPPSSFPPSPHQVSDGQDSGMNPAEQDIKLASQQPPRPTSLMLSQTPSPRSPSSGSANNSSHMLNVPGDERSSRSPGKTRKATLSRKASRSPRPTSRPPPPPSEAPPTAPPSASGHIMSSEASNPLYFSESGASYPPPAPAPTPSDGPTSPPIIGGAPPPPPPPPPIGGVKSPSSSNRQQQQSIPSAEKKPPAQATMNFADQLKQRLVKLESGKEAGGDQTLETSKKRDEPNNNRAVYSQPPSTTAVGRGPATDFSSADGEVLNADRTVFISQETPKWAPSEFLWKGVALFDYTAMNEDEMTFEEGDVMYLTHDFKDGWLEGVCNGYRAMIPGNYVGQMP
ncbi:abl interactor 1-like [Lytechinus variegatus]|uniref:abl interactor 1-like n=1 Tax=Lytechinus variegatus TaxID=7654 RepID=UPI001BB2041D|nr:abl interactor 1-like [Lytechinus variegatus]